MENYLYAFLLTLIAGLSTGIGSLISLITKTTNKKFLSVSLGFSAGVMIYVSMIEIFFEAKESLSLELGEKIGYIVTTISFFIGMLLIAFIDKLIPSKENSPKLKNTLDKDNKKLERMGLFTAIAIAIHNFPEGLSTFVSSLQEPRLAMPIVIAIAIHNIPEGISVSVPIYYATGSKKKAFLYSLLSGLTEPLGAIVGFLLLMPIMNNTVLGVLFAMVSGIMVFISFDELLPSAREYAEHHLSMYGLIFGMIVMAISLLMFS